ncbi:MAG: hypothetical protein ISQ13_02765 [Candidatus Margulisbacteria bacterium]|nr:hypothetical protein [Candidatus Margulisiibacteriota bacterium]
MVPAGGAIGCQAVALGGTLNAVIDPKKNTGCGHCCNIKSGHCARH